MVLKIPFIAILEMEQNPVSGKMTIVVDVNRMNSFGGEFTFDWNPLFPPFPNFNRLPVATGQQEVKDADNTNG